MTRSANATMPDLTPQEREALEKLWRGDSPTVVAGTSGIHPNRLRDLLRRHPRPAAGSAAGGAATMRADRFGTPWPPGSERLVALLGRYDLADRAVSLPATLIDRIDRKASKHNQVRLETLVEHEVERYQGAWKDGAVFPPVLVRSGPGGRLFLLDGNHRVESAVRSGRDAVNAVQVDAPDDLAIVLAIEANFEHGIPLDLASRLAHGVQWVTARGYTVPRAAKALGLLESRLEGEIKISRAEQRAQQTAPRGWETITTRSIKARLTGLVNDDAFKGAAELTVAADLKLAEVNDLVTDLNRAGDHRRQAAVLDERREALRDRIDARAAAGKSRRTAPPSPRERMLGETDRLARTFDELADVGSMFTGPERKAAAERLAGLRERLDAAIAQLGGAR